MEKTYLEYEGLKHYNDLLNDRNKKRLKYKGEYTLVDTITDWHELAPTHIGDVYHLVGDVDITIDDESYAVGDWIIVMNETYVAADGSITDKAGNATEVKVEKFGSAGLPKGQNDGDALIFVDDEWIITDKYGYDIVKKLDETYTLHLTQSNSSQVKTFIPGFTIEEEGIHYKVYIDGTLRSEGVSGPNYDGSHLWIDMGNDWISIADGGLSGCQYWFASGTGEYDTTIDHEVRIVSEEPAHFVKKIDKKYIPHNAIEEMGGNWLPSLGEQGVFYLHKHRVNNGPVLTSDRYSLTDEKIAEGYAMDSWAGLRKNGVEVMSWKQLSAEWSDMSDFFVHDAAGRVGRFGFTPDYSSYEYITLWLNEDGSPSNISDFYLQLYFYEDVADSTSVSGWHKVWEGFPDGGITDIGQLWMDEKLEMID